MWAPNVITSTKVSLNLAGRGVLDVTQIHFDSWCFCNAAEWLVFTEDYSAQVHLCRHCGVTGCEPGNWLSLRRYAEYVFLMPAFDGMEAEQWYSPPDVVKENGAVYLDDTQYGELGNIVRSLPEFEDLPRLSKREFSLIVQWEAPYSALGQFPGKPEFNMQLWLATESERGEGIVPLLNSAMKRCLLSKETASPASEVEGESTLFLDVDEHVEWSPVLERDGQVFLRLDPCFSIEA